ALIPGVLQCRREKRGWSQFSCDQTGFGLIGMAGVFYYVTFAYGAPLFITATTTLTCGIVWMILLAQAFKYSKFSEIASGNKDVTSSLLDQVTKMGDTMPAGITDALKNPEMMNSLQGLLGQLMGQKDSEEDSDE